MDGITHKRNKIRKGEGMCRGQWNGVSVLFSSVVRKVLTKKVAFAQRSEEDNN